MIGLQDNKKMIQKFSAMLYHEPQNNSAQNTFSYLSANVQKHSSFCLEFGAFTGTPAFLRSAQGQFISKADNSDYNCRPSWQF